MLIATAPLAVARHALLAVLPIVTITLASLPFFQALRKADRAPREIESRAKAVFQKTLIAEVQRLGLVGEEYESGRGDGGLGHVVDFHLAAGGRRSSIKVHARQPAIQLAG